MNFGAIESVVLQDDVLISDANQNFLLIDEFSPLSELLSCSSGGCFMIVAINDAVSLTDTISQHEGEQDEGENESRQ